jgi:hypothetical protein
MFPLTSENNFQFTIGNFCYWLTFKIILMCAYTNSASIPDEPAEINYLEPHLPSTDELLSLLSLICSSASFASARVPRLSLLVAVLSIPNDRLLLPKAGGGPSIDLEQI